MGEAIIEQVNDERALVGQVEWDSESDQSDLVQYWSVVTRRKWGILGVIIIFTMLGILQAMRAVPIYKADAKLLVEPATPVGATGDPQATYQYSTLWLFYETQHEIIKSRAIAETVVDKLGLANTPLAQDTDKQNQGIVATIKQWLPDWRFWFSVEKPEVKDKEQARRKAAALNVKNNIKVVSGQENQIISLSYSSTDPKQAADIVNAVAEAYSNFGLKKRLVNAKQATTWLSTQLDDLKSKVEISEQTLQQFQSREGLVDTKNRESIISAELSSYTSELIRVQSKRSEVEVRYDQVRKILENGDTKNYQTLIPILSSVSMQQRKDEATQLQRQVEELSKRYGDQHPRMVQARSKLKTAERLLKASVDKAVEKIRKEYEAAATQERDLRRLINKRRAQMRGLTGKTFELGQLERDVENNRKLYQDYLSRFKEFDVAGKNELSNIYIIDNAEIPAVPYAPNRKRIVFIAILLGVTIGLFFAFLREHLDNTFQSIEDIEKHLRLPVLGLIPYLKKKVNDIPTYVINDPTSSFAEAIKSVRTGILYSHMDSSPKIVLVTSSVSSEGKTTVASNLAGSFSQMGKTLLIEGDLRKTKFKKLFNIPHSNGLTDVLSGQCALKEVIHTLPKYENLSVMAGGTHVPNPLEVVSSQKFSRALENLSKVYNTIVIDAPPLLPVADAIVLARLSDATIFLTRADDTTHNMAKEALKRLANAQVTNVVGGVFSQVNLRKMSYYGKHHYSYYYNTYYNTYS